MLIFEISTGKLFEGDTPKYCAPDLVVNRIGHPDVPPSSVRAGFIVDPVVSASVVALPPEHRTVEGGATSGFRLNVIRKPQAAIDADIEARAIATGFRDVGGGVWLKFTGERLTKLSHEILKRAFPANVRDDRQIEHTIADQAAANQLEAAFLR